MQKMKQSIQQHSLPDPLENSHMSVEFDLTTLTPTKLWELIESFGTKDRFDKTTELAKEFYEKGIILQWDLNDTIKEVLEKTTWHFYAKNSSDSLYDFSVKFLTNL